MTPQILQKVLQILQKAGIKSHWFHPMLICAAHNSCKRMRPLAITNGEWDVPGPHSWVLCIQLFPALEMPDNLGFR